MDPEKVSGGPNRKNSAKPIRAISVGPSAKQVRSTESAQPVAHQLRLTIVNKERKHASNIAATEQ
jgi:hypothetical protein